ncbi:MAG: pantetheine-phosphate adenylyltransferase [Oscillospiraceae bacterium]|nr:pantetheine-phosphate adenylyltransferase [Oscillospiraceae bacterium]
MTTGICPGSFDPITLGHLNIIRRASRIFDQVVVCVMVNSTKKTPLFTLEERVELIERVVKRFPNVRVDASDKLLADYAKQFEGAVLVKGLRAVSDYESEAQMALINKKMNPALETVFLTSSEKYTYISSSVVKEMARYGTDLKKFVPREILDDVVAKTRRQQEGAGHGE